MRPSISCGFFIDWTCFLFVLWVMELLRRWKFDEIEDKSSLTKKPNSYPVLAVFKKLVFMIASFMGIRTPITAMIFIGIFFILMVNLHFSLIISNLSEQVKKLTQRLALLQ